MLHRNGKEIEQIFRNNREIALLYKNGVIIYDKRRKSSPDITITYKSRNLSGDRIFATESGEPGVLTVTSSVPTWNNHALVGWSTNEWDYDNYLSAGDPIASDSDLTLYAVWGTTVQGLIDEGYCVKGNSGNGSNNVTYTISANNYPEGQVIDFIEFFEGTKGTDGQATVNVTGFAEPRYQNAFIWNTNHWLTDARIGELYNTHSVTQYLNPVQFSGVNFKDNCPNLTLNLLTSGTWGYTNNCIFSPYQQNYANSPNCPESLTINITGGGWLGSGYRFLSGASNLKTFTVTTDFGEGHFINKSCSALFEKCHNLETINGCVFRSYRNQYGGTPDSTAINFMFDQCNKLKVIPSTIATNGIIYVNANAESAFRGCTSLETIEPIIDMRDCSQQTGNGGFANALHMFEACSSLEHLSLKWINSSANSDIDLSDTIIDQTSADYIVTNVYENVDTSADGFVYKNIYFPATVTISQAQANRLYQYGWNCYVNGELIEPTSYNISYVNGEASQDITGSLPANATAVGRYTIPTSDLAWNEHGLLGYSETQYPAYTDIATSVYAPGSTITVDHDMTLYPVWNTTFQGLINEGFVTIAQDMTYYDSNVQPMSVTANHYPKELVTDFNDVFLSAENKKVSAAGVVGEGTKSNVFLHSGTSRWLTDDEWYDLYNNVELPYWPQNNQFARLNWSNHDTINFVFRGTGVPFNNAGGTQNTFFYRAPAPETITLDLGTSTCANLNVAFRHYGTAGGAHVKTITLLGENGGPIKVTGNMTGAFENCGTLTTVNGLDISSAYRLDQAFQSCGFTTIPASISSTGETSTKNIANMFKGCTSLQSIGVIINATNVTANDGTFAGDSALTTFYLKGINAQKNMDWDLSATAINQDSANYIVTNLTEWPTFNSSTDTYKSIMFPATISLNSEQIARLRSNGWRVYVNGNEMFPDA